MDLKNDKNEIIRLTLKNEKFKKPDPDKLLSMRRVVGKLVDDMANIDYFNFFPFEIMTPEMMAQFCANHLVSRGGCLDNLKINRNSNTIDTSENNNISTDKQMSSKGFGQIMDNMKKKKFHLLLKDGMVDTFIVDKENIDDQFQEKYVGSIPEHTLPRYVNMGNDFIKCIFNENSLGSNYNSLAVRAKNSVDLFYNILTTYNSNINTALTPQRYLFYHMQTLYLFMGFINQFIKKSMLIFIIHNDKITNKQACLNKLNRYIEILKERNEYRINVARTEWTKMNNDKAGVQMIQELSIVFAFYLFETINNGYKFNIVKSISKAHIKPFMKYNEDYDLYAKDPNGILKFMSESSNPNIRVMDFEKSKQIAFDYFEKHGFDIEEKDLVYCQKVFAFEIYCCSTIYNKMRIGKIFEKDNKNLCEEFFLLTCYDRAHFRSTRSLKYYGKFNKILFKLYELTEKTYHAISPSCSMGFLRDFFNDYIQFYLDEGV